MTQPSLLDRAKQGDPNAIATLMNQTLEPKGVTAKAVLEADCLHVFLSAPRMLNAKTLVDFTQRGILSLNVQPIQQVRVYGQMLGNEQPAWVEAFAVQRSDTLDEVELIDEVEPASDTSAPSDASTPVASSHLSQSYAVHRWLPALKLQLPSYLSNAFVRAKRPVAPQQRQQIHSNQETPDVAPTPIRRSVHYLKLSLMVILAAFATGGTAVFIANSSTVGGALRQAGKKESAIALPDGQRALQSTSDRTHEQQQAAARQYLETMNQAQQAFYSQNKRFASNLEELERAAATPIASHSNYNYKLTLHHSTQAQLTAIPNADGLKSYTAVVSLVPSTKRIVTAICASPRSTKVPPLVFQSTSGLIQCPEEPN